MLVHERAFRQARMACAYFFICPGMVYGVFTARMPAYKQMTGATDSQIGLILLAFGLSSLVTLFTCHWFIAKFGIGPVLRAGVGLLVGGIVVCGLTSDPLSFGVAVMFTGFGTGLCDVAMNASGIEMEHRFKVRCMSFLHASYSFGGMLGAVSGSICAAFTLSPFWNATIVFGFYLVLFPRAYAFLPRQRYFTASTTEKKQSSPIPVFVVLCGIMAMLIDAVEGSVGEWGSLFLYSEKGATQQLAALVFASFCLAMIAGRLSGDWLRSKCGDFTVLLGGSICAFTGMAIAIFSPSPIFCLSGYSLVGLGAAPLLPIFFSRAGDYPGIDSAHASTIVSVLAYSGMLFYPPLLGFLGEHFGLGKALLVALGACVILALGAWPVASIGRKPGQAKSGSDRF